MAASWARSLSVSGWGSRGNTRLVRGGGLMSRASLLVGGSSRVAGGWAWVTLTGEVEQMLEIELEGSDRETGEEEEVRKVKRGAGEEEEITARPGL